MHDDPNKVSNEIRFVLPQIEVTNSKTNAVMLRATPSPGSTFDVNLLAGITSDELVQVVADLVEIHYKSFMGIQKRLFDMGMGIEQVGDLFFPGSDLQNRIDETAPVVQDPPPDDGPGGD